MRAQFRQPCGSLCKATAFSSLVAKTEKSYIHTYTYIYTYVYVNVTVAQNRKIHTSTTLFQCSSGALLDRLREAQSKPLRMVASLDRPSGARLRGAVLSASRASVALVPMGTAGREESNPSRLERNWSVRPRA